MLICPICNNYVEDNATFCPNCGTQFAVEQQTYDPANYTQLQYNQNQYQPPMSPPPKKNKGLLIAIIVVAVLILAGIGFAAEKILQSQDYADTNPSDNNSQIENIDSTTSTPKTETKDFSEGLISEKIGSVNVYAIQTAYSKHHNVGICYKADDGKYGIMSFDGTKDTGAKYTYAEPLDKYFMVTTCTAVNSAADMNCMGLVDVNGNEILPMEYASIKQLNERYYMLCVATDSTTNKDEALIYSSNSLFSVVPDEDDDYYTGVWYIYDIISGKKVDGATGTKAYVPTAKGDFIEYITDDKKKVIVNPQGTKLTESMVFDSGTDVLENGHYVVVDNNDNGTLYTSAGKKLFEYNTEEDYSICDSIGDYFYASKYDGDLTYYIVNKKGKIISSAFSSIPSLIGDFLFVDNRLYKIDGTPVIDGEFKNAKFDDLFKNTYMLYNDSSVTCLDKSGNIIYQGPSTDAYDFIIKNDAKQFYSFKDKDFTIQGDYSRVAASWVLEISKDDQGHMLIDTISGETLVSGYDSYDYIENANNTLYVYAKTLDGTIDIYAIK